MLNRIFVFVLAMLIANPVCCCQDLSSSWFSNEGETSEICGCQRSSEGSVPSDEESPCSSCPSKIDKQAVDASPELPRLPVSDLDSECDQVQASCVLAPMGLARTVQSWRFHTKDRSLCQKYCVYLV